ncbi:MAG TPA: histidine triad nucleotide-binding protein [Nitrospiria bacterium]|jgi:histidine triad (HIT) family protein
MNQDCLFCKIVSKTVQSKILFEDENLIAIEDINPQAPVHLLMIPKVHRESAMDLLESDQALLGSLFLRLRDLAQEKGVGKSGFRVVLNTGKEGGQTVDHIHFHLLGGRGLGWPPG